MARHHFAEWKHGVPEGGGGLTRVFYQPTDMHSHCTRCGVKVKVAQGTSTTVFFKNGTWTRKRPACEGSQ